MSTNRADTLDSRLPKKSTQKDSVELSAKDKLFDLIVCGICLDTFKDPHTLDCGHNYCGECLHTWFDQNKICPSCNWPATRPPIANHTLNNIISQCTDQENDKRMNKSLWKKIFPVVLQTSHLIDLEDDVARCTVCHWELDANYTCERCEIRYANTGPLGSTNNSSDDAASHSSQDADLTDFVVSDEHDLEFDDSASEPYGESGYDDSLQNSRPSFFDNEASDDSENEIGTNNQSIIISSNDASSVDDDSDVVVNNSRRKFGRRAGINYSSDEDSRDMHTGHMEEENDTDEEASEDNSTDNHMMEISDSEFQKHEIDISDDYDTDYPDYTELARATDGSSEVNSSSSDSDKASEVYYNQHAQGANSSSVIDSSSSDNDRHTQGTNSTNVINGTNSEFDSDTDPDYDFVSPPPPPPKAENSRKYQTRKRKRHHKKHKKPRSD